jgi:hypothetical protein
MDQDKVEEMVARLKAQAAQDREAMAEGAAHTARFFNELVEAGIHRDEALHLTSIFLQTSMEAANSESMMKTIAQMFASGSEGGDE